MALSEDHVARNRRYWEEEAAAIHGPLARAHWSRPEPRWGLWGTPESQVGMFPGDVAGMDAIELGCGTGYVSSWLARAGARPVGVDVSASQLATAGGAADGLNAVPARPPNPRPTSSQRGDTSVHPTDFSTDSGSRR
ncbi:class I SAM-dependent methyltransferase [Nonomuraea roseola]|uniref:Class I SAM-dependent methyltransferase n=1 Tax=Nonomuraea roseola TaxID=46179 RepID=A0ABV5PVU9_9ACTN